MLPYLNSIPRQQQMTEVFNGYNHNLRIGAGEMWDMENLSSDNFPTLSPRKQRGIYAIPQYTSGIIAKEELCFVEKSAFFIGLHKRIEMGLSTEEKDCPKKLLSMGAYVIIMPDRKYINTSNPEDRGDIDAVFTSTSTVNFSMCQLDGNVLVDTITSPDEPEKPKNGQLWLDTSHNPHELKRWSSETGAWAVINTTYIKIESNGIDELFKVGDGIEISGVTGEELAPLNGNMVIEAIGPGYIVVTGIVSLSSEQNTAITVSRKMPILDYMTECNNRLWGCRYGLNDKGEYVNEIYACKLGDFKNWRCFAGVSTDSYIASCGSDGPFTGAITHMGNPLFFKENVLHKVYGNMPANFQIQQTQCRGVQEGCDRSLAIVNEILYYKSRTAVCAYDGSLPAEISYQLGDINYHAAVAGGNGNKYYISMADDAGNYNLFVYDCKKRLWHREDSTQADDFASYKGEMYYIDHRNKAIMAVNGTVSPMDEPVKWMALSGIIGAELAGKKRISRLTMRAAVDIGTNIDVFAEYDSTGAWEPLLHFRGSRLQSVSLPIRPHRCDHLRLKIVGEGPAKIFSLEKVYEQGGY